MVVLGSGAHRSVKDYMLTRYACYLIAQNGDPKKEKIAFAQSYFSVQTRKQELIEERITLIERAEARDRLRESEKRLSQNIYECGVDDVGFGRIRSKGDQALFGGHTTMDMKARLGIADSQFHRRPSESILHLEKEHQDFWKLLIRFWKNCVCRKLFWQKR